MRASRRNPVLILILAAAASAATLLALGDGLAFFADEWELLLHRRGLGPDAFLAPVNEHLMLVPTAVFKALQAAFGMESTLPFRAAATAVLLGAAALLFTYLRRPLGEWPALAATVIVLFLGAASEVLLLPINIGFAGSLGAGLAMLLALRRGDRRGDVAACGALAASIACTSLGLVFAAGAAVEILLRGGRRAARAYVVALPLSLYAAWYAGWGHEAASAASLENALSAPQFVVEGIGSSAAALLGLFAIKDHVSEEVRLAGSLLLLLGCAAALVWLAHRSSLPSLRDRGRSRELWVAATLMLCFWLLAAISEVPGRTASASRYMYPGAVFVLLVAAQLLDGVRPGRRALAAVALLAAVGLAGNLVALLDGHRMLERESALAKAELGAVELARERVDPVYTPTAVPSGAEFLGNVDAGSYLSAVDRFGSPADEPDELADRSETARAAADRVLAQALDLSLARPQAGTRRASPPGRAQAPGTGPCPVIAGRVEPFVVAAPAALTVRARRRPAELGLRRFATRSYPIELGAATPDRAALLRLPADASAEPWELIARGGSVSVCG